MAQPSLIKVDPGELVFDLQSGSTETKMKLMNVSGHRVGFKLFTDHSDTYVFQPKSGFVDGSGNTEIGVKLLRVPKEPMAVVDHVTVVKARTARDDELDREKEWRTALPEDDANMQIVRLKTRFGTVEKGGNEDVWEAMRRMEERLNKKIETSTTIARYALIGVIVLLLIIISSQ